MKKLRLFMLRCAGVVPLHIMFGRLHVLLLGSFVHEAISARANAVDIAFSYIAQFDTCIISRDIFLYAGSLVPSLSLSDKVPQSISSTEPAAASSTKNRFHIRQRAEICACFLFQSFFLCRCFFPAPSVAKNDCDAFRFKLNPMMILNNDERRVERDAKMCKIFNKNY